MTSPSGRRARRWFVTGASGGMGRAIVERALADGDAVVASMRTPDALTDLQQRFGQALEVEALDVRDARPSAARSSRYCSEDRSILS